MKTARKNGFVVNNRAALDVSRSNEKVHPKNFHCSQKFSAVIIITVMSIHWYKEHCCRQYFATGRASVTEFRLSSKSKAKIVYSSNSGGTLINQLATLMGLMSQSRTTVIQRLITKHYICSHRLQRQHF